MYLQWKFSTHGMNLETYQINNLDDAWTLDNLQVTFFGIKIAQNQDTTQILYNANKWTTTTKNLFKLALTINDLNLGRT